MEDNTRKARELIDAAYNLRNSLLFWTGTDYGKYKPGVWTMADNPVGGDEVYMSDFDLKRHPWDEDAEGNEYVALDFTLWGDYIGASYTRSNERSLRRDYPDLFIQASGFPGAYELYLPADADIDEYLFDELVKLADEYPVYDETDMSELETEIFEEDLNLWIIPDVRRELPEESADAVSNDDIRQAIYRYSEETDLYPEMETAVSCYFDVKKFVEWFAPDDQKGE